MKEQVTIKTLAANLSVSPSTITRAFQPNSKISDSMRKKILDEAERLHYVPNQAASRLMQKNIKIGVLLHNTFQYGIDEITRGIIDAHRDLSAYKVVYHIEYYKNDIHDEKYFEDLLHLFEDDDALILSGICNENMMNAVSVYQLTHPNVVYVQSYWEGAPCLFRSMHDPEMAARMAAEFLYNCISSRENAKVLLFTGLQNNSVHLRAKTAFTDEVHKLNLHLIDVVDMQDNEDVLSSLVPVLLSNERMADPDTAVDGIYITSGISLSLCKYIEEHGLQKRIALVTFDTPPELYPYLKNRVINATIYQNHYRQAKNAFTYIVLYLMNGKEIPEIICPPPQLVMQSNLAFYESAKE